MPKGQKAGGGKREWGQKPKVEAWFKQQGSLPVGQVKSVSDLVAAINGDGAGPVEYNSVSKACKDLIKPGTRPDGSKKEPLLLEVVANRAGGGGKGNTGAKAYTRLATPKSSIE